MELGFDGGRDERAILGGGTQNKLLNQFAANATGKTLIGGPVAVTTAGNIMIEAIKLAEQYGVNFPEFDVGKNC